MFGTAATGRGVRHRGSVKSIRDGCVPVRSRRRAGHASEAEPERPRRLDVAHHRRARASGYARGDRANQRAVLPVGELRGPGGHRHEPRDPEHLDCARGRPRSSAAASPRRPRSTRWSSVSRSLHCGNDVTSPIAVASAREVRDLSRGRPLGGERGRAALDDAAVVDEIAELLLGRDRLVIDRRRHRRRRRSVTNVPPPRPRRVSTSPAPRSIVERASQRDRGDPEIVREPRLGGKPVTRAAAAPSRSPGRGAPPSRRRCRPA